MMKKWFFIFCTYFVSLLQTELSTYELALVTMFRNEAPYLREWIEFHQMVGVDYFWLYNDCSEDNWQEILQPYIQKGIVEVIPWGEPVMTRPFPRQIKAIKDGLKRAVGKAKWVACIDVDEFLLPMKGKTVTECLKTHYERASGVYISWRNFGTGGVTIPIGKPTLFHLTACSSKKLPGNAIGKSIVRPECISFEQIWHNHDFPLLPGFTYMNGDGQKLRFEGNRLLTTNRHHDKFIRINHYKLRDERFFREVRMGKPGYGNKEKLLEDYVLLSRSKDYAMTEFIMKKHPEMYKKIWKQK